MYKLFVLLTSLFIMSCSHDPELNDVSGINEVELENLSLTAESYRANGEKDADWKINILNGDSIMILASTGENLVGQFCYDHQIYGKLIKSNEFDFEIVQKVEFYGSGCWKPRYPFLYSDSIPLYVDSTLLKYFLGSKVSIVSKAGIDTKMTINSNLNIFRSILDDGNLDTSEYTLTIFPSDALSFYPFTLRTGDRCAASIRTSGLRFRYFLNKIGNTFNLIIDKREYYGKPECDGCFDTILLK